MPTILPNGLSIINHRLANSHRVTLALFLPLGAWHDPPGQNGISHLAEHLCFRGAGGAGQADFYRRIESIGGHLRGVTHWHHTVFELTVLPEYFGAALDIICELFFPNRWSGEDIRREKAIIRHERQSRGFDFSRELLRRYDRRPAILGSESSVARLSAPRLQQWKALMFQPQGAIMALTGRLSEEDMRLAQERLAAIPACPLPAPAKRWQQPAHFAGRTGRDDSLYVDDTDTAWLGLTFDLAADAANSRQLDLLCSAVAAGLYSPLLLTLREELALIDSIQQGWDYCAGGYVVYWCLETGREQLPVLLEQMAALLPDLAAGLAEEYFSLTQACFATNQAALLDDAQKLAYRLGELALTGEPAHDGSGLPIGYQDITLEQINRLCGQMFVGKAMAITVVTADDGRLGEVEKGMKRLRAGLV